MALVAVPTTIPELLDQLVAEGMSQAGIARALKVSHSAVSAWRRGLRRPDTGECERIAVFVKLPPDEVLRMAGHLKALAEERSPYDQMPSWARYLPMLSEKDAEYVGRLVQSPAPSPAAHPPTAPAPRELAAPGPARPRTKNSSRFVAPRLKIHLQRFGESCIF